MTEITKHNIDMLLDQRQIECQMRSGNWWTIRRNGATRRWARDKERIRVPFKFGLYGYGQITETDFVDDKLNAEHFRLKEAEHAKANQA